LRRHRQPVFFHPQEELLVQLAQELMELELMELEPAAEEAELVLPSCRTLRK
jgi:hypothetical protein